MKLLTVPQYIGSVLGNERYLHAVAFSPPLHLSIAKTLHKLVHPSSSNSIFHVFMTSSCLKLLYLLIGMCQFCAHAYEQQKRNEKEEEEEEEEVHILAFWKKTFCLWKEIHLAFWWLSGSVPLGCFFAQLGMLLVMKTLEDGW